MNESQERINILLKRIEMLSEKQSYFSIELRAIKAELENLRYFEDTNIAPSEVFEKTIIDVVQEIPKAPSEPIIPANYRPNIAPYPKTTYSTPKAESELPKQINRSFEKFIGENLINKIGIIILVIGVGIGAKYAIDNQLISPLTRIILGYLVGLGLLGTAYKLKAKYTDLSSVILSGSMAVMYFITFFAYSLYSLFPQLMAFTLMFVFTVFTVLAALHYKREVIAIIGLVGAYFVPFLLSNNSGQVEVLFSYVLIINLGVLFIAFTQLWKMLRISSFIITWLIFFSWFVSSYMQEDFAIAAIFLSAFFAIFHIAALVFNIEKKENSGNFDMVLTIINSLLFYSIGLAVVYDKFESNESLAIFTLLNAVIYFVTVLFIRNKDLSDRNIFIFTLGMVLTFLTLVIPIQFEGNWITILWSCEAVLLYWIGQNKDLKFYTNGGFVLLALATFSVMLNWMEFTDFSYWYSTQRVALLFNMYFLTSVIYTASVGAILYISRNQVTHISSGKGIMNILNKALPVLFILSLYYIFFLEIKVYWEQMLIDSKIVVSVDENNYENTVHNWNLDYLKSVWLFVYTMGFLIGLLAVNKFKIKSDLFSKYLVYVVLGTVFFFLTANLYNLSELRESYLSQWQGEYYTIGFMNIAIRYISIIVFVAMVYLAALESKVFSHIKNYVAIKDIALHTIAVWLLTSEVIHWIDMYSDNQSYKLGISILWGVYSLILIILGIWKLKKHIRLAGFALFSITLLKLFFYDITTLDTISKTVIFVIIGLLMLVASYLYNKYNGKIDE